MSPTPKISVVVPVYNMEKYVLGCLESIKKQTFKDYEVIIVNDGSTDRSLDICNEFVEKSGDGRFKVVSKTNGGISDARNFGIANTSSQSKFVTFIDSDDEISEDYLESLMAYNAPDLLVIGRMYRCNPSNHKNLNGPIKGTAYENIWKNKNFLKQLKNGLINSCCVKCYSLEIIRNKKIRFESSLPEDTTFNVEYLKHVSKVILLDRAIYYYYIREGSITTKAKESLYRNYIKIQQELYRRVDPELHCYVDLFVYPQYRANTMKFLKNGVTSIPTQYLKNEMVKQAMKSYHPVSIGDRIAHFCLRHRLFFILQRL